MSLSRITLRPNKSGAAPRAELQQLDRGGHGGYTLALAPVAFGLLGYAVDSWIGWTPALTIVGAVYGVAGGVYKLVTDYQAKMKTEDRTPSWASRSDSVSADLGTPSSVPNTSGRAA